MTYAGSKVYVKASRFPGQVDQWSARACPPFPSMGTLAAQKIFCPPVSMDVLRAKHGPGAFGTVHVFCGKQKRFIFFGLSECGFLWQTSDFGQAIQANYYYS